MLERPTPSVFSFFSVLPDAEKDVMLINLAASLATHGCSVLLVDACMTPSSVLSRFCGRAVASLLDVACQERVLDEALRRVPEGFSLARLSRKSVSAATHLQASRLAEIFDVLTDESDITLVNGELNEDKALPVPGMEMGEIVVHMSTSPGSIKAAYALIKNLNDRLGRRPFSLLVTGGPDTEAKMVFANMAQVANRYLAAQLNFLGSIPADEHIRRASGQGRTVLEAFPLTGAAIAFKRLARQFSLLHLTKGTYGMATDSASLGA
ncbi:MAG: antiactivator of flagellar biosynthesis FleN protein [Herbaspirillum sp.]